MAGNELIPVRRIFDPSAIQAIEPFNPRDVVEAFLRRLNPNTRRVYAGDLRDFAGFLGLGEDAGRAFESLLKAGAGTANALILRYRAALEERGLKSSTVARRLSTIRGAVRLARTLGQVEWTVEIPSPKVRAYRDTRGPTDDDWKRIEARARAEAAAGVPIKVRDLAIVTVIRNPALRRSELIGLDLADVELSDDGSGARLQIVGKGRTDKEPITLAAGPTADLKAWLRLRGDHPGPVFHRLDRGAKGGHARLSDRSVGNIIPELCERAGVPRRVTPHGLRHNAITTVLGRTNGNIRMAQKFSRHADPRTLMIYDDNRADLAGECARLLDE